MVEGSPENGEENIDPPSDDGAADRNERGPGSSDAQADQKRFGSRGGGARSNGEDSGNGNGAEKQKWWPSCYHARWTKLDKTKFKDRIVWLKECRRCGKKKTEVVYRDLNSRQVYTGRDVFAVAYRNADQAENG